MAYDAADGYILLLSDLGETWEFNAGAWTQLFPSSSPQPQSGALMAYDAADGYVLYFGGFYQTDTWEFKGGSWTQLSPSSSPSPRYGATMVYDAADGTVILFGGHGNTGYLGDTWEFYAGTWTQLSPSSSPQQDAGPMAYDAADNYILFSGYYLADTWEFQAGVWTKVSTCSSPSQLSYALMAYDAADGYVLRLGGEGLLDTSQSIACMNIAGLSLTVSFTVSASPTAGIPATFTATVTGGTTPYSYSWDFGDGSAAITGDPAAHTYTTSGDVTVTLTVIDANQVSDTSSQTVSVAPPSVKASTSTGMICDSPVDVNQASTCTVTVADTSASPTTPTGTVTFTPSGTCTLAGAGDMSTCSASITPVATGSLFVSASYLGDTAHEASIGSTTVTVTATTMVSCGTASCAI